MDMMTLLTKNERCELVSLSTLPHCYVSLTLEGLVNSYRTVMEVLAILSYLCLLEEITLC